MRSKSSSIGPERDDAVDTLNIAHLYGGEDAALQMLRDNLTRAATKGCCDSLVEASASADQIRALTRTEILRYLFTNQIAIDDIIPEPTFDEETRQHWLSVMRSRGSAIMVASDGSDADPQLALSVFAKMELLDVLCAPSQPLSDQKRREIEDARKRFRDKMNAGLDAVGPCHRS